MDSCDTIHIVHVQVCTLTLLFGKQEKRARKLWDGSSSVPSFLLLVVRPGAPSSFLFRFVFLFSFLKGRKTTLFNKHTRWRSCFLQRYPSCFLSTLRRFAPASRAPLRMVCCTLDSYGFHKREFLGSFFFLLSIYLLRISLRIDPN